MLKSRSFCIRIRRDVIRTFFLAVNEKFVAHHMRSHYSDVKLIIFCRKSMELHQKLQVAEQLYENEAYYWPWSDGMQWLALQKTFSTSRHALSSGIIQSVFSVVYCCWLMEIFIRLRPSTTCAKTMPKSEIVHALCLISHWIWKKYGIPCTRSTVAIWVCMRYHLKCPRIPQHFMHKIIM